MLPIATPRLLLRELATDDGEAVHAYASDPEVTRYLSWGPNDAEATRAYLERARNLAARSPRPAFDLGIVERESGELVGGCGLYVERAHYREWEIGYCLRRDRWGRGLGSEAVAALVGFGVAGAGAHRIYAAVDPRNEPSARLLRRLGFRLEGRLRSDSLIRGEWRDSCVFAVLEDEWAAGAAPPP